jgi:hypothetical protein
VLALIVPGEHRVKVFSYSELRKATHDFSGANKIGEGGFGSVFRVNTHNLVQCFIVPCVDSMVNTLAHIHAG